MDTCGTDKTRMRLQMAGSNNLRVPIFIIDELFEADEVR